jgi:hypothetical protein
MRKEPCILVCLLAALAVLPAMAQEVPKVDPRQVPGTTARQVLLRQALDKLQSGSLVQELNQNAKLFAAMTPEERRRLQQRYYAFLREDPQRQVYLIEANAEFQKLTDGQRKSFEERAAWLTKVVASLNDQGRKDLLAMPPQERAKRLLELKAKLVDAATQPAGLQPATSSKPASKPAEPAK